MIRDSSKPIIRVLLIVLVAGLVAFALFGILKQQQGDGIGSFDECAAAGNPVLESYPEQCTANGKTFVREVSAEQ